MRALLRRLLRAERRIQSGRPGDAPSGPPEPARAAEVLELLALEFKPGATVMLRDIARVGGVNPAGALEVRRWARFAGRWPYVDGTGGRAAWSGRKGGESS